MLAPTIRGDSKVSICTPLLEVSVIFIAVATVVVTTTLAMRVTVVETTTLAMRATVTTVTAQDSQGKPLAASDGVGMGQRSRTTCC